MIFAVIGAIAGLAAVVSVGLGQARFGKTDRAKRLDELRTAWKDAPTAAQRIPFFIRVAGYHRENKVAVQELDFEYGDSFFETLHSSPGMAALRDVEQHARLRPLYIEWHQFRIHRPELTKPSELGDALVAGRWGRLARSNDDQSGRILWHETLHETLGTARLVFWRLRFESRYKKDEMLEHIAQVCGIFDVDSSVVYELLGPHDLLVRCWVPQRIPEPGQRKDDPDQRILPLVKEMQAHLEQPPQGTPLENGQNAGIEDEANVECDFFLVTDIKRHWWWNEGRRGEEQNLPPLEKDDIARVQNSEEKQTVDKVITNYNAGLISYAEVKQHRIVMEYKEKGYIRHRVLRDGIKFATIVREPARVNGRHPADPPRAGSVSAPPESAPNIGYHMLDVVKKATSLRDRSLYEGRGFTDGVPDGGFPHFLILGRVESSGDFKSIRREIIEPLVATQTIARHYAPPLTYVMTGPEVTRQTCQDRVWHPENMDAAA